MALEEGDHVWYWNDEDNAVEHTSMDLNIPRAEWFPGSNPSDPTDYGGHGKQIFNYVFYADTIKRGQPQMRSGPGSFAWLNNNPGNITDGGGGADFGQIPGKLNWHRFMIFSTPEAGRDAIRILLRGGAYSSLSILGAFRKYAPAGDGGNRPDDYAAEVAGALGVDTTFVVGDLDDDQMGAMQDKIAQIEGWNMEGDTLSYDSDLPPAIQELLA